MRRLTLVQFLAVTCLAVALASPARAALNHWSSGGPFGGPVLDLAFDPHDAAIVYAATAGGVFRSEDHGATWTAANLGVADAVVQDLEVDPASGTVYLATSGGIQNSADQGRTWQIPTLTAGAVTIALDPANPATLYSAVRATIQKSDDGGISWTPGQTLAGDVIFLKVDPVAPANVYAATLAGFYRSTNGGGTWTLLPALAAEYVLALEIDPVDSRILYAGTSDGVFKSTDRGLSWSRSGAAMDGQFVEALALDPSSPSTLLAIGHAVYRSRNAGGSWSPIDNRFFSAQVVAFDPSSSSTYFIGGLDGIHKSTDSGASWFLSNTGLTASIVTHLAVDPHRPGTLFASAGGALHKSSDAGASWVSVNGISQLRALALDPKTPFVVYAATNFGLFRSQDAGATWVRINSAETSIIQLVVDPQTPSTLYLSKFSGGIRKSMDGGITWNPAGPELAGLSLDVLVIAPSEPETIFASDHDTGLFKSTNGGRSWTPIGDGLPSPFLNTLAIHPHDANILYAGVTNGRLYKSTNGGATWFASGTSFFFPNVDGIAIDPFQPSRIYATNGDRIYLSTNSGATWSRFDEGVLPGLTVERVVLDPVNPFLLYTSSHGSGVLARADIQPGSSLRLNGDRFLVKMGWATGQGPAGPGHTQALTRDTGYAWFFQETNVEVLLKVLDGCGLNGHFWVFAAGLTNVRTDITVADTQTGATKIYHNPPGQPFQPLQDTSALACDAATGAAAAKELSAASEPVLLRDGRFRVTAEFAISPIADHHPAQGALLTDDAAYLWFFDQNNVEVFLKVVDGCAVNGRFWVFSAGLTDLEVRITVEDTKTGASKLYQNPQGTAFRPIQDTSAFGGCG